MTTDPFRASERASLYRIIEARRDVRRRFLGTPVPDVVLDRVLRAAHHAPSVGLSQPWDFLVLTDFTTRQAVADLVERDRRAFAAALPGGRAAQFGRLKVEAILDAPLNVVVTTTLERGGAHVLGRASQPETAAYSTCLAVENLWLAARAEGVGVGWVSFYDPPALTSLLNLPDHVQPLAYLCMGYVERFDPEPELALAGWARSRPLSWAVHREHWGQRAVRPFTEAAAAVGPPDRRAQEETSRHLDRLTKPRGSLGRLESCAVQLAGIAGMSPPPVPEPATVAIFAGDHGVVAEGVTPWPSEVTAQMVDNFLAGGAAINALARQVGAEVVVVDVGVAASLDAHPGLLRRKVRPGTANLGHEDAMGAEDVLAALDVGAEVARELVAAGSRCLITGDMGIGNTTPSAAVIAALTGRAPAEVTGRGTGIDDPMWATKVAVIEDGLARLRSSAPLEVLAAVGGIEIAALAGYIVGAAASGVPVIVDGVIAAAGLIAAAELCPSALAYCFAGHLSVEPGSRAVLDHLGLEPMLDLGLRLGEGTGATLALPLLQASARIVREMATFDGAGVTDKQ